MRLLRVTASNLRKVALPTSLLYDCSIAQPSGFRRVSNITCNRVHAYIAECAQGLEGLQRRTCWGLQLPLGNLLGPATAAWHLNVLGPLQLLLGTWARLADVGSGLGTWATSHVGSRLETSNKARLVPTLLVGSLETFPCPHLTSAPAVQSAQPLRPCPRLEAQPGKSVRMRCTRRLQPCDLHVSARGTVKAGAHQQGDRPRARLPVSARGIVKESQREEHEESQRLEHEESRRLKHERLRTRSRQHEKSSRHSACKTRQSAHTP